MVLIMEIGNILRDARIEKDYSLDDIQDKTKIQKRYIAAIEDDNFDALPGRFYARAFIKEYAEVVDLDVASLLAQFDASDLGQENVEVVQNTRMKRSKRSVGGMSRFFSILPTIIVILLVVGILFVGWTLLQKAVLNNKEDTPGESDQIIRNPGSQNTSNESNDTNDDTDDEEAENEVEEVQPTFEVDEIGTGSVPLSEMTFTFSGDTAEVKFTSSGESWLGFNGEEENATDEFEKTEDYATASGISFTADTDDTTFDVSKEEYLYFHVGYTPNLQIFINDVELEYPAESTNQKIRLKLEPAE